jgi:hypothetical protein
MKVQCRELHRLGFNVYHESTMQYCRLANTKAQKRIFKNTQRLICSFQMLTVSGQKKLLNAEIPHIKSGAEVSKILPQTGLNKLTTA